MGPESVEVETEALFCGKEFCTTHLETGLVMGIGMELKKH